MHIGHSITEKLKRCDRAEGNEFCLKRKHGSIFPLLLKSGSLVFMATTQNFKSAFSNIPSLTKALVTSLIVLSCAAYIYTYRTQIEANDPEAIVYQKCPVVGILPGL